MPKTILGSLLFRRFENSPRGARFDSSEPKTEIADPYASALRRPKFPARSVDRWNPRDQREERSRDSRAERIAVGATESAPLPVRTKFSIVSDARPKDARASAQ